MNRNLPSALILSVLAVVLLAGCAGTPQAPAQNASSPPAGNASAPNMTQNATMTCNEYCPLQPHIQCVGAWNISGTYPDCSCAYSCAAEETPEQGGQPETGPEDKPTEPLAVPTNKSIPSMLDDALEKQRSDFYRTNDGQFTEREYTWVRESSGGFLGGAAPASDIEFDGEPIASIQASGFIVFEDAAGGSPRASGAAIFNDTRTRLDDYSGTDAFSIDYSPSMIDKKLRDCWVYSKDYSLDKDGKWMLTYFFKCERVLDK